ncbi:hypothetical protein BD626DRAFT_567620 [Schizophyllum amplum]|uniref:Uncharacterized protein n=1 Tax=Schizophyllum amplum TaxID=97359 RepID=A0A550CJ27_9AGAR|nr:hypothetical protein BD626DRAFT_567620 [Auriculariopsis ampla]
MHPHLPAELTDLIIDAASQDRESLKACALAHRSFLPRSQQHLFKEISLIIPSHLVSTSASTSTRRLLDIFARSPHLADCVRILRIDECLRPARRVLGRVVWGEPHGLARETGIVQLMHILPELEHIALTGRDKALPPSIVRAFAIPTVLHVLELVKVTVPVSLLQEVRLLRALAPGRDEGYYLNLSALLSLGVSISQRMATYLCGLLYGCKDTLRQLDVWIIDASIMTLRDLTSMHRLPFAELVQLEELTVRSPTGVTDRYTRALWVWLLQSLDTLCVGDIVHGMLYRARKTLKITIDISYYRSSVLDVVHYAQLDGLLARMHPKLRSCTVRGNSRAQTRTFPVHEIRTSLENCFSQAKAMGVLHLDVVDTESVGANDVENPGLWGINIVIVVDTYD